jgi:hypothetical protein
MGMPKGLVTQAIFNPAYDQATLKYPAYMYDQAPTHLHVKQLQNYSLALMWEIATLIPKYCLINLSCSHMKLH